jgi:hypothetical protein
LNEAEYEFFQHKQPWIDAGATPEQIRSIRAIGTPEFLQAEHISHQHFDTIEMDVIQLTIEMTRNVKTSRDLMLRLKESLGTTGLVEITGTIAGYNMVSRFLVALELTPETETETDEGHGR